MKPGEKIDYEDREPKGPLIIAVVSLAAAIGLVVAAMIQVGF